MRTRWITLALALIFTAAAIGTALAQAKRTRATKEFMRDKLELAQKVLEGLAQEDFDLISAKSKKLSAMSQEAPWQVFENPDYAEHSATFRRHSDSLARAAKQKDLDAATLAYVRLTMSCVDCHKLVRGKLVASANRPSLTAKLP